MFTSSPLRRFFESIGIFRRMRFSNKSAVIRMAKELFFLGERLIYLISEFLTSGVGLEWRSGARAKRFHELDSDEWLRERCENSKERGRGEERKRERKKAGAATVENGKRSEGAHKGGGVAIWFCNLDKESFLPRYWLLRVRTSSLLKLGRISRYAIEQLWGIVPTWTF